MLKVLKLPRMMMKKNNIIKRVFSLILVLILSTSSLTYADTVVIGSAPTSYGTDKVIASNASGTTFLQNSTNGPGLAPSSAYLYGQSPIQGVYDTASSTPTTQVDSNNVASIGPTTKTITSPAANISALSSSTSRVVTNGLNLNYQNDSTADIGPTTVEVLSPGANGPIMSNSTNTNTNTNTVPSYDSGSTKYINTDTTTQTNTIIYQVNNSIQATKPVVKSEAALVVNATTRQIYYSKNGFASLPPAGLANLVTARILLAYKGLDDTLAVTQTAISNLESGANTAGLKAGDQIKVRDAIGAMFVKSCADVANVVAENVSGSIPNFVSLMNSTVKNWGCIGTVFVNPTGLNSDQQVTNVYDMAIIMDKVCANDTLKYFLNLSTYTLPATSSRGQKKLTSSNYFLQKGNKSYYEGITASRLGYTSKAKYTMASEVDINGFRLIAVVLKSNNTHFNDSKMLLDYAKTAFVEVVANGTNGSTVYTTNGNDIAASGTSSSTSSSTATTNISSTQDTQGSWAKDNTGWYFVKSDGTRATNQWIKQSGKLYCVDNTGYMVTGWRVMTNGNTYYFDTSTGEFKYNTWVNTTTGAYYLQSDGALAKASAGSTKNIVTQVGTYTIDENGKALAKVS